MLRPAPSPDQVSWLTDPPTPRPSRRFASGVAGFVPVHSCGAAPAFTGFPSIRAVHGSVAAYLMAWPPGTSQANGGRCTARRAALMPWSSREDRLVTRARQVSWLSDRPTPRAFPADSGQWLSRVSSPNTVTGSRRIRTAFPIAPLGNSSAKATTPYQTAVNHAMQPTRAGTSTTFVQLDAGPRRAHRRARRAPGASWPISGADTRPCMYPSRNSPVALRDVAVHAGQSHLLGPLFGVHRFEIRQVKGDRS